MQSNPTVKFALRAGTALTRSPLPSRYTSMRNLLLASLLCVTTFCFAEDSFPVPNGYVLQILDPTDGKIARPSDWYYKSEGTPSGWLWTLSAEDPSIGDYETGLRMQLLVGVEKKTKKSRYTFAQNFLENKRTSTTVVRECPETDQGQFRRQCLEVIENIKGTHGVNAYHILYSVLWGNTLDMVVVTTFGAPQDKWEAVKKISEIMSAIELIGPNFGK